MYLDEQCLYRKVQLRWSRNYASLHIYSIYVNGNTVPACNGLLVPEDRSLEIYIQCASTALVWAFAQQSILYRCLSRINAFYLDYKDAGWALSG